MKTIGLIVAGILAFWFIDVPWTVRAKVTLLTLLPIDDKSVSDMTLSLCKSSYGKEWLTCYSANAR